MTDVAVTDKRSRLMEGFERHPRDAIVVVAGLATALVLSLIRIEHISDAERDVFDAINHLSNAIRTPTEAVMMLGTLIAVPIVAIVALAFRRVRLATVLLAAGCLAYAIARVSKLFIRAGRPLEVLPNSDVIVRGAAALGLGFPSGHSAVSAALAFGALPYLPRPWRYVALSVPVVVGIARVYVGAHLPLDILGGWGIGIAAAFAVHLLLGRPSLRQPGD
jgi:membrane-associated phospholipid phosphatase